MDSEYSSSEESEFSCSESVKIQKKKKTSRRLCGKKRNYDEFKKKKKVLNCLQKNERLSNLRYCKIIVQILISIFQQRPINRETYLSLCDTQKRIIYKILEKKFTFKIEDDDKFFECFNKNNKFGLTTIFSTNNKTKLLKRLLNQLKKYKFISIKLNEKLTFSKLKENNLLHKFLSQILDFDSQEKKTVRLKNLIDNHIDKFFLDKFEKIERNFLRIRSTFALSNDKNDFFKVFNNNLSIGKKKFKATSSEMRLFKSFNSFPILVSNLSELKNEIDNL